MNLYFYTLLCRNQRLRLTTTLLAAQAKKCNVTQDIHFLGNTSVATIPTMTDLILKKKLAPFEIKEGNVLVMASVGAEMHCNALIYKY